MVNPCKRSSKYSFYNWRTVCINMMPVILTESQRPPGLKTINYHSLRGRSRVITVRTVIPCISCRPTCRCRAHSAVGPLFGYSRSAFSASRTYCSRNPRWCPSQETTWWPALGAQISQVSSTAEGRRGWGLVSTPAICFIASTPAICCIAKPVVS